MNTYAADVPRFWAGGDGAHTTVPPSVIEPPISKVSELGKNIQNNLPYQVPDKLGLLALDGGAGCVSSIQGIPS
jgi:hypothetical protein